MNILDYYDRILVLLYDCPDDMVMDDGSIICDGCIGNLSGDCLYHHFYDAYFNLNSSRAKTWGN